MTAVGPPNMYHYKKLTHAIPSFVILSTNSRGLICQRVEDPIVLLGAIAKLRKATTSFVPVAICPSVRREFAPTGRISMKFDI